MATPIQHAMVCCEAGPLAMVAIGSPPAIPGVVSQQGSPYGRLPNCGSSSLQRQMPKKHRQGRHAAYLPHVFPDAVSVLLCALEPAGTPSGRQERDGDYSSWPTPRPQPSPTTEGPPTSGAGSSHLPSQDRGALYPAAGVQLPWALLSVTGPLEVSYSPVETSQPHLHPSRTLTAENTPK